MRVPPRVLLAFALLTVLVGLTATFIFRYVARFMDWPLLVPIAGAVLAYAGITAGLRLIGRAAVGLSIPASVARQRDTRAPVVYLRPFDTDGALTPFFARNSFSGAANVRFEEVLTTAFKELGPVVALAPPGIQATGAYRVHTLDDSWQRVVVELLKECRIVLLVVGVSPSLLWEVATAVELVRPSQLFLVLGPGDDTTSRKRRYDQFRTAVEGLIPARLPAHVGEALMLTFDDDWTPVTIGPPGSAWRTERLLYAASAAVARVSTLHGSDPRSRAPGDDDYLRGIRARERRLLLWLALAGAMAFFMIAWYASHVAFPEKLWQMTLIGFASETCIFGAILLYARVRHARLVRQSVDGVRRLASTTVAGSPGTP